MEREREKEERKFDCWLEEVVEPWFISLLLSWLFDPNWLRPSSPVLPTLLSAPTTSFIVSLAVAVGWIVRSRAGA